MSNEQSVVKRLKTRVRSELADYVPKAELETLKGNLETKIGGLEAKLGESVPKEVADFLRVRLEALESRVPESVPKGDVEAGLESVELKLEGKIEELERKFGESSSVVEAVRADLAQLQGRWVEWTPKAESEAKFTELETKLADARLDLEEKFSRSSSKVDQLQIQVSDAVPKAELELARNELQSKIADVDERRVSSVRRCEVDELRARVAQLEGELSRTRTDSKAEADALLDKTNRLEVALAETHEKLNAVEVSNRHLASRLAEPKNEIGVFKEKLAKVPPMHGALYQSLVEPIPLLL